MTHLSKFIFGAQRQKETVVGVHSPEAGHFFFLLPHERAILKPPFVAQLHYVACYDCWDDDGTPLY